MICEALILALNRHSYSVGNFLGYHKKSSSLFEKYIPFSSPPESVSLVAVSPHWGIDALEPESSFPNLRQKSCLGGFLVVSHRFSCEFMELHLFVGVESVNTFPISTLLPGVVSGKMAQWQFSWIVLLISGASGLRMRQVALCPRTLCSGVLSEVFFAKHLSISICKILQVPSKNWESRKGTADMHVQQLMCHNWFSHFISKLQDSNLRFWNWLGWIFLDFRWMKAVLTREVFNRFFITLPSLFFPRRSHSFALGRTQSTATTRSHGKFEGVVPCVKETLSNSMIGTPKGWKDCMKKLHYEVVVSSTVFPIFTVLRTDFQFETFTRSWSHQFAN